MDLLLSGLVNTICADAVIDNIRIIARMIAKRVGKLWEL